MRAPSVSPGAAGPRAQMEGMVTDLQLAREKQAAFDDWMGGAEKELAIDLSDTVLTTGFWPTYKARARAGRRAGRRPRRPPRRRQAWQHLAHGARACSCGAAPRRVAAQRARTSGWLRLC